MKLLIATSGGGHFSPALAIIQKLPRGVQVLLVGRKYALEGDRAFSLEFQTAEKLGIPFKPIVTGRLQRTLTTRTIPSLFKIPVGLYEAFQVIHSFNPDVVLSFGGYVALPVVAAAFFLRKPVVVHEQTLRLGLSNKLASYFAKRICVSFKQSLAFFPTSKTVLTGNPLREEIRSPKTPQDLKLKTFMGSVKKPLLYITGGSTGSHVINSVVSSALSELLKIYTIIHQTGDAKKYNDYDLLLRTASLLNKDQKTKYFLTKFIDPRDVGYVMQNSDLVLSRSGINTVTELLFLKKPAVLIPLPTSQNDEQRENAKMLEGKGLAHILEQKDLTAESLIKTLSENFTLKESKDEIVLNSAEKIIQVVTDVAKS